MLPPLLALCVLDPSLPLAEGISRAGPDPSLCPQVSLCQRCLHWPLLQPTQQPQGECLQPQVGAGGRGLGWEG